MKHTKLVALREGDDLREGSFTMCLPADYTTTDIPKQILEWFGGFFNKKFEMKNSWKS